MGKNIVFHNTAGEVIRVLPWTQPQKVWTVYRKDNRRLEVVSNLSTLISKKIPFETLCEATAKELEEGRIDIEKFGYLELVDLQQIHPKITKTKPQSDAKFRKAVLFSFFVYISCGYILTDVLAPLADNIEEMVEEKKQEIVKVVRQKLTIPNTTARQTVSLNQNTPQIVNPKAEAKGWKRSGALAALGQLNKSNQKGGLDLGAVKASAGPGLGGTQGSGGVQTSLYGKGLTAAPLGAGHNINGGGGYGTKGKGGGKAGYGTLSLVGATGASLIPIPEDATVEGGLDSSLISEVVNRNIGQVRFCYEQGLQLNNALSGRVTMNWIIDGNGTVKIANVKNTSLNDKTVEDCILRRLRTWKFPIPEGNQEVPVSYPFLLKRTGRG
jgi:hypothetical protein